MKTAENKTGWWSWITRKLARRPGRLGARGESFAAGYLAKQGMRIIGRNRRKGKGEIDLIALEGDCVVFVEVRTRTTGEFMTPEASVRYSKKRAVTRTVRSLMRKHRQKGFTARIDLVAIIWPEGAKMPAEVRHHKSFMPVDPW